MGSCLRRSSFLLAPFFLCVVIAVLFKEPGLRPLGAQTIPETPADVGQWGTPVAWPIGVEHAILLEDGNVLVWGSGGAAVWNPQTAVLTPVSAAPVNVLGAGHARLDGAPFVVGGTNDQFVATGLTATTTFSAGTRQWTAGLPMNLSRWRPTATVLGDGRILVTGGVAGCANCAVQNPELFDPLTQTWTLLHAAASSTYPFMFALPGGRVLQAGSTEFATLTGVYDPAADEWSTIGATVVDGGSAVMFRPGVVLKSGSAATPGTSGNAVRTAYVLDMTAASPGWIRTASMGNQRAFHNLTVLADGSVFANGGATAKSGVATTAVLPAEIWTPATASWKNAAAMSVARPTQSVSLLLPDGRVLVAGPMSAGSSGGSAEVYSPPYLFKGSRPAITTLPSRLSYSVPAFVGTSDTNVSAVSLIGLGAAGPSFDQGQRFVPLSFAAAAGGVMVTPPGDAGAAPPGTYLLVVTNQAGVPSVGRFVSIGGDAAPASIASLAEVSAAAVQTLAIDVSAWGDQGTSSRNTVTSSTFSTHAANELMLAFVSADYSSGASTTVTGITGAGLTWQLVVRTNAQRGTAEVWRAVASQVLSNASVTATLSQNAASSMTVVSFTGADTGGTNGSAGIGATRSANAASGAPTATLTTTRDGSWVFAVGTDWDSAVARTLGPNQTMVHQYPAPVGDTYWVQRLNATTPTTGTSVTINDTAPTGDRYDFSVVEVLPALSGGDLTAPTVSMSAPANGATVSGASVTVSANASDNVGVAGVQFRLDGANLGAEDTSSPFSLNWNSTTVANGSHTLTAVARDAAGNMATAASVTVTVSNSTNDTTLPAASVTAPANGATVSGSAVIVSANASDNVGVVGVQFKLDGANFGAEDTASPYSVNWNTTTAADGSHTLTAVARDAAGNTATSAGVTVTVANGGGASLAIDATAFGDRSTAASSIATSAFSTTAPNELLLAFISTDGSASSISVTGVTGGSLTWQLVARTNAQLGTSEIWRAFSSSALTNVTVTASLSQSVSASVTVVSFRGVDTSGTNGSGAIGATRSANANPGAPAATLTTTRAGSWVFGVGNDWDHATARTLGAGQTMVHQVLSAVGDTYWVQRTSATIPGVGTSVTINDTAPTSDRYNLTLVEILPSVPTDPTPPTVSMTAPIGGATLSGATVTVSANASDNVGVAGVQFTLDGANLGAEDPTSAYSITWDTRTAANGSHTLAAVARDAAGNKTTATSLTVTVANPPVISSVNATSITATSAIVLWTTNLASNSQIHYGTDTTYGQTTALDPTLVSLHTQSISGLSPVTVYHYQVISTDTTGQTATSGDFMFTTKSGLTFALSGSASAAAAGATITLSGDSSATTTADGTGAFGFSALQEGNYVVTPALAGFSFSPSSQPVSLSGNVSNVNFVASPVTMTYSISGTISPAASGGAGASVALTGAASATTVADNSGNYSFGGLVAGSYTVTPTSQNAAFTPASRNVVINAANVTGVNFTAASTGNVIFFDDFNGTSLSSEWTVIVRHGEYAQAENECNTADAVGVANGFLTITTTAQATTCGDFNVDGSVRHAPQSWPYRTGDVQWKTRSFTYGTVEVRAKFPAKQTVTWPAIWLLGTNCQNTNPFTADQNYLTCPDFSPSYKEIDIVECDLNNWCQLALWTGGSFPTCGFNVDTNFHTFRLTWTPGLVSVAIDGQPTGCSYTDHVPNTPMFLILQTQTGGNGGFVNNALLPAEFVIDYVKVTQP